VQPGAIAVTLSVVIVNYNGQLFLGELLDSLSRQLRRPDEVILVDNASADGSTAYVREHFPGVRVLALMDNLGFAEGNNVGFGHASGDYIAVLNSDTVLDELCIDSLVRALDADERIGVVVPKVYLATHQVGELRVIDCAGAEFNNIGFCWGRGMNQLDRGHYDMITEVPGLTACAAIIRRSALAGEPPFDKRFFMYYEELELSLRVRARGYKIVYVPTAVVHHKRGGSVKRSSTKPQLFTQFYGNRNRVKILATYYPFSLLLANLPLIFLSLLYWNGFFLLNGGFRLCGRAVAEQVQYAIQGLAERSAMDRKPERWLPWMKRHGLHELLAMRSAFATYVS
jgi:GT2 family glycosyltransferase